VGRVGRMLAIGSLFSGIGGLELGLEMAGLGPVVWQVERDKFCQAVLAKHWPTAERFDDVCTVGAANLAPVHLICGGFPCQNTSRANSGGTRSGLAGGSSGLWSEFARVVGELRPAFVIVENVASGAELWFDTVVSDLEFLDYGCLPLPIEAQDVGAPHERARVFVVARHADARSKPVVAVDAQVAHMSSAPGRFPGWSARPDLRVDDVVPGGLARLGNAVMPAQAEVVGRLIRELLEAP